MRADFDVIRRRSALGRGVLASSILVALYSASAYGEEEAAKVVPPGLPAGVDWQFNFDGTFGAFGFGNSLYRNPKADQPSGNLSDNWFEGSVKPAIGGTYTMKDTSQIYGKVSGVGERTWSGSPTL